jgi:hypothetical protein
MPALSNPVQLIAIAVSLALVVLVVELVRRTKLTEQYSLIWLLCGAALLVLSLWKNILDVTARWLGIYYPPAVLLLVLVFFGFVASLYFSVVISGQRRQVERLIEELAIMEARVRELEAHAGGRSGRAGTDASAEAGIAPAVQREG